MAYRFEEFEFDDANFRLSRTGEAISLEPKALRLLLYLLENSNRLVRKQELLDYVWPEANVGENALARAVGLLRKGLGEDTRVPRFIETVPTLGYRFIAQVTVTGLTILGAAPARDSKSLFVLGRPDQGAMHVLDLATGKFVPYLDGLNAVNFVISPDRQWMAYVEYPSHALWTSRLDGSERPKLATSGATMPQWSPDGKSLVYSDWHHLYLVSADGGEPEALVSDGTAKMERYR